MTDTSVHAHPQWQFDVLRSKHIRDLCLDDKLRVPTTMIDRLPRVNLLQVLLATTGLDTPKVGRAFDPEYWGYFKLLAIERQSMAFLEACEYGHRN